MARAIRRVVTGHRPDGRSTVLADAPAPNVKQRAAGNASTLLWVTEECPAQLSGAAFPEALADRLRAVEDDPEKVREIGVEVATALCEEVMAGGAPGLHFYTLNRSTATREIYARLGLSALTR